MIEYNAVTKIYKRGKESHVAVNNVSFNVEKGNIVVLLGPSGCGKTTLLKLTNRLVSLTSGSILINGRDINDYNEVELRQSMGYVIQQIGLFPNKTIGENISLIPKIRKWDKRKIEKRVEELLHLVNLEPEIYRDRYPAELSGGQAQRVGVARALAVDPEIILMDEPFGAIDPINRVQIQDEVLSLQSKLKKTIIFVTHDISEALKMGDKIAIFRKGELIQYDTPFNILINPKNEYIENFIGTDRSLRVLSLIKVKRVVQRNPKNIIKVEQTIDEAYNILKSSDENFIYVIKKGKPLGYLTEDILCKAEENVEYDIEYIVKPFPAIIREEHVLSDVMGYMLMYENYHYPVVNKEGILIGTISYRDIKNYITNIYNK
ncbi:MAG: betaine/proline/choline family ABC transporter ATP-binding protein [Deferribacterota bacterium]|nr:betaine/proline/choline family ABC transporter ATP-binding protein [Deferribacterota bacterium]